MSVEAFLVSGNYHTSIFPVKLAGQCLPSYQFRLRSSSSIASKVLQSQMSRIVKCNRLCSIKVDKHISMVCRVRVYLEKTVLRSIETRKVVKLRGFDQSARSIITPAMIAAAENGRATSLFSSNGIRAVTAHVVELIDNVS